MVKNFKINDGFKLKNNPEIHSLEEYAFWGMVPNKIYKIIDVAKNQVYMEFDTNKRLIIPIFDIEPLTDVEEVLYGANND